MYIFKGKKDLKSHLSSLSDSKKIVGFVPTMGALHQGHLALVSESLQKTDFTVVSIFVNPTQFDKKEDLEKYPNTISKDIEMLQSRGCHAVYIPTTEDIYDEHVHSESFNFDGLDQEMEGKFRTGHFDGVGTVVKKLFEIVQPNFAFFGEKDFQQLQIIKKLTVIENINTVIVGCPIFREKDGLAMSSRNMRLTEKQRKNAAFIYKTLQKVKANYESLSLEELKTFVKNSFEKSDLFELEYFTIADEQTLKPISSKSEAKNPRAFIAVFTDTIRLIDNISLQD